MPQKVLIIDDSPQVHDLLRMRLLAEGVEIRSAFDGASGLTLAPRIAPDLILLDIDMPDMDGFEVCMALKAEPALASVPVVLLSGAISAPQKLRGLELGALDYLSKPFDAADVRARVRAALKTKYLLDLLATKAQIDGLSGLWNRSYFENRLASEMSLARRTGDPVSVIVADIDHFRALNIRFGRAAGDEVLRGVARCLAEASRAEDVVCRIGPEEFGIVVPNAPREKAAQFAERLRSVVNDIKPPRAGCEVTLSFGVAQAIDSAAATLSGAQAALAIAKEEGRNRIHTEGLPRRAA